VAAETRNVALLQAKLQAEGLDAVVAVNKKSVIYLSNAPTAWADWLQRRADGPRLCLVVWPAKGEPVLIVSELEADVTSEHTLIPRVELYPDYIQTPYEKLSQVLDAEGLRGKRIGIEKRAVGAGYWDALTKAQSSTTFVEAGPLLDAVRAKKTPAEIEIFRRACARLDRVFLAVFSSARPGMTEYDLHTAMFETAYSMGAGDIYGGLLSGERAMAIHRPAIRKPIEAGDIIRTDYVAWWEGRAVNHSRVFIVGEPNRQQKATYKALREIELEVYDYIKPGVRAYDLFKYYLSRVEARGFKADLPLLGHNIGVEGHEEPMIVQAETGVLEEGMVICVEPFLQKQFQIQDQLLITANGVELLSKDFDTREIFVIE
jgi:Xaa-Pro aminopeptidase